MAVVFFCERAGRIFVAAFCRCVSTIWPLEHYMVPRTLPHGPSNTTTWPLEHSHRTLSYGPSKTTIWTFGHYHGPSNILPHGTRTLPHGTSNTTIWPLGHYGHYHMATRTLTYGPSNNPRTLPHGPSDTSIGPSDTT